jgi:anti-anti-sigma factor
LLPEQEGVVMATADLSTREYGGHVVVALHGELDIVDAASVMAALAAAAAGNPRIIVDLAALEFIDCCALGVLGRVRAQARPCQRGAGRAGRRRLPPRGNRRVITARCRAVMNPRALPRARPGRGQYAGGLRQSHGLVPLWFGFVALSSPQAWSRLRLWAQVAW